MTAQTTIKHYVGLTLASGFAHALCLGLFVLASHAWWASAGKAAALALAAVFAITLLVLALRQSRSLVEPVLAASCLAVGYLIAFFSLGISVLPGFLKDSRPVSVYLGSVVEVWGFVFLLYLPCSVVVFWLLRYSQTRSGPDPDTRV